VTDFEKLAYAWHELPVNGRLAISLEWCTTLFRYANYGICSTPDLKPPDVRQGKLDLQGGSYRRHAVTIDVS
jgi:hypothetical protein